MSFLVVIESIDDQSRLNCFANPSDDLTVQGRRQSSRRRLGAVARYTNPIAIGYTNFRLLLKVRFNLSVCGSEQHTFSSGPFPVNKCLLQNIGVTDTSNSTLYNHIKSLCVTHSHSP